MINQYYQVKYKLANGHYTHQNTNNPVRTIFYLRKDNITPLKVYRITESLTQYSKLAKLDVSKEYLTPDTLLTIKKTW